VALEAAGAGIMRREKLSTIGDQLVKAGESVGSLSTTMFFDGEDSAPMGLARQRMSVAAELIAVAGKELVGIKSPGTGRSFLKGGL
jgi:hypothetical protein